MGASLSAGSKGAKVVSRDDLSLIAVPEPTPTYSPVSHYDLVKRALVISQDIMSGWHISSEKYALARDGQQMYALVCFQNGNPEIGVALALRNSLDKSLVLSGAGGSHVSVCTNGMFRGDIVKTRKHVGDVWAIIEEMLLSLCYRMTKEHTANLASADRLKGITMTDRSAWRTLGDLYGMGIISPRQLTVCKAEWHKPEHEAFSARTAWSLYNDCTQALKTSPPDTVMEDHIGLSRYFDNSLIIDAEYEAQAPAEVVPSVLAV